MPPLIRRSQPHRKAGVSLIATKGPSLDMSTAYGRAMAGLLGEFDTMESEVKSERQQLANREAAIAGKARTSQPRPFGWQADYVTAEPAEKAAVEDACRALLGRDRDRGGPRLGPARPRPRKSAVRPAAEPPESGQPPAPADDPHRHSVADLW